VESPRCVLVDDDTTPRPYSNIVMTGIVPCQAYAVGDTVSSHMTISTYQRTSWFDFLIMSVPRALESAFDVDLAFKKGLPINYLSYMGTGYVSAVAVDRAL